MKYLQIRQWKNDGGQNNDNFTENVSLKFVLKL
jgi:hypothetical protein